MASITSKVSFICFYVFALYWTIVKAIQLPANVTVPAIIVFGDSIVDTGNNNHLFTLIKSDFTPYGKDFVGGVATGRFTNSKTPSDLIAEELGIKDLVPAYLDPKLQTEDLTTGVSFASGGTGYDTQTSTIVRVISLTHQLKMFKEYIQKLNQSIGVERTNHILSNSVYLVVAGSNDIANTYFTFGLRRLQYKFPSYADLLVSKASNFITEIYKLGARTMAIFGAPPIGCLPIQRTLAGGFYRSCVDKYNNAAKMYNTKLTSAVDSLDKNLTQSKIVYIDIYNPLFDIIQNPQAYGFENVDKGCCGTRDVETLFLCNKYSETCSDDSKFLFWDSIHPTEQGYKILVAEILREISTRFWARGN